MIVGIGLGIWVVIYQDGRQGKQMPVTTNETLDTIFIVLNQRSNSNPQSKKQLKSPIRKSKADCRETQKEAKRKRRSKSKLRNEWAWRTREKEMLQLRGGSGGGVGDGGRGGVCYIEAPCALGF